MVWRGLDFAGITPILNVYQVFPDHCLSLNPTTSFARHATTGSSAGIGGFILRDNHEADIA
jgi:hypothetical protein